MDPDEAKALSTLAHRLTDRFPGVSPGHIEASISKSHHQYEGAPVRDFVPLLVEHEVLAQLKGEHGRGRHDGRRLPHAARNGADPNTAAKDVTPATRAVPVCSVGDRVADVRDALAENTYDCAHAVVVLSGDGAEQTFTGLVPIERLLAAPGGCEVSGLLEADAPVITTEPDEEQATYLAVQQGLSTAAVVDVEGRFQGLLPASRLLAAALHEHEEDLARIGGYLSSTSTARRAVEEPLSTRLGHRLPWLLVGLLGAALSAWLVGGYEDRLTATVQVAFFIPGIVYLADAVGTQTEALIIRGLSIGSSIRAAFRLEALTGLALGTLLAALAFPAIGLTLGMWQLALAVSLALALACAGATVIALLLPWFMAALGKDPAFGSGPVCTVVQDLISLGIYLVLVAVLVT